MSPRMPGSVDVAVSLCCHRRLLACKSWAARVPQCAGGVPPRRIFGRDVGLSAVMLGSLLHDCYMGGRPAWPSPTWQQATCSGLGSGLADHRNRC
jgi:hypothetical protein